MDLEFTTKQKALLFLDRTYFLYFDAKTSQTLRVNIPPTSVRELEVLNENEIRTLVKTFVQANNLSPSILTILLSEQVLFYKQIPQNQEINEQTVKEFIDAVPFDDVGYRVFTIKNGHLIVATNKDLYTNIKEAFDVLGFEVRFVLPSVLVESVVPGVSRKIDEDTAKRVLTHYEKTKEFNMLDIFILGSGYVNEAELRKKRFSTLYILLGVFALLIIVLVVMLGGQQSAPPKVIAPSPTLFQGTNKAVSEQKNEDVNIQLIIPQQETSESMLLADELQKKGYKNIIKTTSSIKTQKTIVAFNSELEELQRGLILSAVKSVIKDLSSQEIKDSSFSAVITIEQ